MKLLSTQHPLSKSRLSSLLTATSVSVYFDLPHNRCLKVTNFSDEEFMTVTLFRYDLENCDLIQISSHRVSGIKYMSAYSVISSFRNFPEYTTRERFVQAINLFLSLFVDEL